MLIWKGSLSGTTIKYTTDIYNFKSNSTHIQAVDASKQVPFMGHSNSAISIPYFNNNSHYPLLIVDGIGIIMETQQLQEAEGTIQINVGAYRPGVYLYKIGEQTGKFVVN